MNPLDPKAPDEAPIPGSSPRGDARHEAVLGPLDDLLADLDRLRDGNLPSDRGDRTITIWHDEKNIYVDSFLRSINHLNLDISIYDGKVLIRMER